MEWNRIISSVGDIISQSLLQKILYRKSFHKLGLIINKMISVTRLVEKFFEPFDADVILEKMALSGSLERNYPGKTAAEVKEEWRLNGEKARVDGILLHSQIENYLTNIMEHKSPENKQSNVPEFQQFLDFYQEEILQKGLVPYKVEWKVNSEKLQVRGIIDAIFIHPETKLLTMVDWKRCKEIKYQGYSTAKVPLQKYSDCNFVKYVLGQNFYKLLAAEAGLELSQCFLAVFHPQKNKYEKITIPDIKDDALAAINSAIVKTE